MHWRPQLKNPVFELQDEDWVLISYQWLIIIGLRTLSIWLCFSVHNRLDQWLDDFKIDSKRQCCLQYMRPRPVTKGEGGGYKSQSQDKAKGAQRGIRDI